MGTNEYSQPASKSSWDGQDFGDVKMVVKMAHFHKSSRPQWVKMLAIVFTIPVLSSNQGIFLHETLNARLMYLIIIPQRAGAELIRFSIINIMVADALAPCVARSSAAMIFRM